jgi:hypothetical protein
MSDEKRNDSLDNSIGQTGKDNKSTGPRTPEGKRRSSLNARRHSITARVHIATPEESDVYDAHMNAYLEVFQPVGTIERDLAIEIASLRFRLKRAASLENSIFALGHEKFAESLADHPQAAAALAEGMTWISESKNLQLLTLYESRIRRALEKATEELNRLQAARKQAYAQAQQDAIRLVKVAMSEGEEYDPGDDFEPASAHGEFVFSESELARLIDRRNRIDRSYKLPDLEVQAACI